MYNILRQQFILIRKMNAKAGKQQSHYLGIT